MSKDKTLKVKYTKSVIGYDKRQKSTIKALGFKKLQQERTFFDTPVIRGMLDKVQHLVAIEEVK